MDKEDLLYLLIKEAARRRKLSTQQKIERQAWALGKATTGFLQAILIGTAIKKFLKSPPPVRRTFIERVLRKKPPVSRAIKHHLKYWARQTVPYGLVTGGIIGYGKGYGEKLFSSMYRPLVRKYYQKRKRKKYR